MSAQEKRYPRERFTKQLHRMCQGLDQVSSRDFEYGLSDGVAVCSLVVKSLWVVGSYARGAVTCGDLDVVVEYTKISGAKPMPKVYTRAFFGATPGVRFYDGVPQDNSSGADFSESVLIWTDQDQRASDWQSRIESIIPDADAGRASRNTDCIPLRSEQVRSSNGEFQRAARWHQQGILEWDFFPLDDDLLSPIPIETLSRRDSRLIECTLDMGKKTRELVPAIWRIAKLTQPDGSWREAEGERATLRCGDTLIHVGVPSLSMRHFDSLRTRQLMLVPHRTARGPNGLWVIRRGPKHPHVLGLKKRSVYFLGTCESPQIVNGEYLKDGVRILELFDTKTQAKRALALTASGDSTQVEISHATGIGIYDLIVQADVLELGIEQLAVTDVGRRYLEHDTRSSE